MAAVSGGDGTSFRALVTSDLYEERATPSMNRLDVEPANNTDLRRPLQYRSYLVSVKRSALDNASV